MKTSTATVRADEAQDDTVRADRMLPGSYRLAAPVQRDDKSWVMEVVISTPGVNNYPNIGRVEYVSEEAIRSDSYLEELGGLTLMDDASRHTPGIRVGDAGLLPLGTLLSARWDDEQKATIGKLHLSTARGIKKVRADGVTGVSLQYTPTTVAAERAPDGTPITHTQTARHKLNHLLLTHRPNDRTARIRADEDGEPMNLKELLALLNKRADEEGGNFVSAFVEAVVKAHADLETVKAEAVTLRADAEAAAPALLALTQERDDLKAAAEGDEPRADSATAGEWKSVIALAERLEVEVKDDANLVDVQRAVVTNKMPTRADSEGASLPALVDAIVAGMGPAPTTDGKGWSNPVRADQSNTPESAVASMLTRPKQGA